MPVQNYQNSASQPVMSAANPMPPNVGGMLNVGARRLSNPQNAPMPTQALNVNVNANPLGNVNVNATNMRRSRDGQMQAMQVNSPRGLQMGRPLGQDPMMHSPLGAAYSTNLLPDRPKLQQQASQPQEHSHMQLQLPPQAQYGQMGPAQNQPFGPTQHGQFGQSHGQMGPTHGQMGPGQWHYYGPGGQQMAPGAYGRAQPAQGLVQPPMQPQQPQPQTRWYGAGFDWAARGGRVGERV